MVGCRAIEVPVAPRKITQSAHIIHADQHGLKAEDFDRHALSVVYRLQKHGFAAYLVGGCIRDLLCGLEPKDFDVATDATPEEAKAVFKRSCRLIGRRFRLAHIHFGRDVIEVATFRGNGRVHESEKGRLITENVYGPMHEDAARRDFSVNAMYFDPSELTIHDYHQGYEDVHAKRLRLVGDPGARYREDPVRLLRAVRFAAKLNFQIEADTLAPISGLGDLLDDVPAARLFDESLKLFMKGHAAASYRSLDQHDLLRHLFPDTVPALEVADNNGLQRMLAEAMANTDERIRVGKPTTPAFLFGVLLWPALERQAAANRQQGMKPLPAAELAADKVISRQVSRISIPRRFSVPMREIWSLQPRFNSRQGKRAQRLYNHPRFRAAYDFLLLRAVADPRLQNLADWWTELQELDPDERRERLRSPAQRRAAGAR